MLRRSVLVATLALGASLHPAWAGSARVRVIHNYSTAAVPDPATVDVRFGKKADVLENPIRATLEYGDITRYARPKSGPFTAGVFAAGTTTALFSASLSLPAGTRATLLARQVAVDDPSFTVEILDEASRKRTPRGQASVRVIHGIPAAAANDVRVGAAGVGCLTPPVSFPATAVLTVPAGSYTLGVFPPGDPDCAGAPLPGLSGTVTLRSKVAYTAIARVAPGDPSAFQLGFAKD